MDKPSQESFKSLIERGLAEVESTHTLLVDAFLKLLEARGKGDAAAFVRGGFNVGEAIDTASVQAISYYFQLLNLAEEQVANRSRRRREKELGASAEPGRWGHYFRVLKDLGLSADEVREAIACSQVEAVFTKHPTEAKRWSVLRIHREIVSLLNSRDQFYTAAELNNLTTQLGSLMERLWLNGEIFAKKPGVSDELENLMYYLGEILPRSLSRLDFSLSSAWQEAWPEAEPLKISEMPLLRFGSWVGGDRDGHPLVTSEVTESTLGKLRSRGLEVIRERLDTLAPKLAFTPGQTPAPQALLDAIEGSQHADEPWQAYVNQLSNNLDEISSKECKASLGHLSSWLTEAGAPLVAELDVQPIIRLLEGFGLHLARIDVRQNSAYYEKALVQIMEAACIENASAYPTWSEEEKLAFLNKELSSPRPLTHWSTPLPAEASEARKTLRVIAREIAKNGTGGVGTLIVSMTRSLSDLLTVYVLCREVGLVRLGKEGLCCALPVAPLYETFDDLECSPGITDAYLSHPVTRNSLDAMSPENRKLTVMLGYSDSNKDTGILASQWALQRAQLRLAAVGEQHETQILFFHGRGGTVGRGAGPTHRFLEALPKDALDAGLRLTEQGEVIGQKYNTAQSATANLEALLAGTVGGRLLSTKKLHDPMLETAMSSLSQSSQSRYRKLLEKPGFMKFYRQATPIDAIELSRIGSRPSRRTGQATLDDLRAIPWVFSWNQSRFYLPGWYGVGSGLAQLESEQPDAYAFISTKLQSDSFLRYLFYNVESSLASADAKWMNAYIDLVQEEDVREAFRKDIFAEFALTNQKLGELFLRPLPERRPRFCKTLQLRDAPLDALHAEQIALLKQLRQGSEPKTETVESLLLVINAIASGLRTTG